MNSEYSSRGVHTMTLTLWLSDSSTAMTLSYFSSAVYCGSVFSFVFLLLPQKSITNTMRSQNVGGEKKARIRARGEIGKRVIFILSQIIDEFKFLNWKYYFYCIVPLLPIFPLIVISPRDLDLKRFSTCPMALLNEIMSVKMLIVR